MTRSGLPYSKSDGAGDFQRRNSSCRIASKLSNSTSLVSYNSSGDELSHGVHVQRSRSDRTFQSDSVTADPSLPLTKSASVHATETLSSSKQSEIKVVKTTAKSSWDSSDSDFDHTGLGQSSVSAANEKPKKADPTSLLPSPKEKSKSFDKHAHRKHRRHQRSGKSDVNLRLPHTDRDHTSDSNRSSSRKQGRTKKHKRKRSRSRKSSLYSRSSSRSSTHVNDINDDRRSTLVSTNRSYSRNHSARSSKNSEYSSRSSRFSDSYRGHHRCSQSSSSSSRAFSHGSHRRYRSHSHSGSRSDRRRRRHRHRSYRRHYRRRSYSSRSRSHSWRTSDDSSSFRSSRSSLSHRSAISRHRSSTARRSSSLASTTGQRIIGVVARESSDVRSNKATPISGNGATPLVKNPDSIHTAFSLSSVAETVSAAVKRVTNWNQFSKQPKSHEPSLRLSTDSSSPPLSTSSAVLVDIPLPKDVSREESEPSKHTEPASYIGPQLPPELARRFGLVTDVPSAESKDLSTSSSSAAGDMGCSNPSSDNTSVSTSNSLDYLIPPEKVEQYRALQEQAKQHALRRRNNLLTGTETEVLNSNSAEMNTQAQQLLLLQQQLNLLGSSGFVYPTYSTNSAILSPYVHATGVTHSSVAADSLTQQQQLAQLSEDARMRSLSALLGAQQQQQLAAAAGKSQAMDLSIISTMLPATLQQQLQQNQTQQVLSALAALQAAQSSNANVTVAQPNTLLTAQLLQQLANQQSQKLAGSALATPALMAYMQQQKLQAQLQRQSVDALQRCVTTADSVSPVTFLGDFNPSNPNTSILNPSLWSSALSRIRAVNAPTPVIATPAAVQSQAFSTALLAAAAAQQQQQQQLIASAIRQSAIQQTGAMLSPVPHELMSAAGRLLPQQQQQQQLLLQLLQQKQSQQQHRLIASTPTEQSLIQVQLAAALHQQRQQQLAQLQQQQQALATASSLAASQSQRQQTQDSSGKS